MWVSVGLHFRMPENAIYIQTWQYSASRVDLSAYFQKLWCRERVPFGAYCGEERGLKTKAIQCLILLNNRYQLFFGTLAHKLLHSKIFGPEQDRDLPWLCVCSRVLLETIYELLRNVFNQNVSEILLKRN